jgi:hypothetical protein
MHSTKRVRPARALLDDLDGEIDLGPPGDAARREELGGADRTVDERVDARRERLARPDRLRGLA